MRWLRFNAVGVLGVAVQICMLQVLNKWLGIHYLTATIAAVEIAIIHNFLWHERWTWKDRSVAAFRIRRFIQFQFTNGAISLVGNTVLMRIFTGLSEVPVVAANLICITACSLINFLASDRIVFR
jgi:putative flippase GtrA